MKLATRFATSWPGTTALAGCHSVHIAVVVNFHGPISPLRITRPCWAKHGGSGAVRWRLWRRGSPRGRTYRPLSVSCRWRPPTPSKASRTTALSADHYRLRLTLAGTTLAKLRQAQDLLRHAVPSGSESDVIDRALTVLIRELTKKKFAETDRTPARRPAAPESRHIPAEVKRAVVRRDGGRCAFCAPTGHRCDARAFLEFHHVRAFAHGGEATESNIELRCRPHNGHEWRRDSTFLRLQEEDWLAQQLVSQRVMGRAAHRGTEG